MSLIFCQRFITTANTRPWITLLKNFTSSKLLAKTQPEYADATRMCCPHTLHCILSTSHQTSSATRSLAATLNFLTIRQTTESHPDLVNQINTTHQHVQLSWESALHSGYIRLSDLHSAAYLLALRADKYGAIKERLLSSHPDLRNVDPLQLQTTIQTYTIALDLDAIHIPAAMQAVLPPPKINCCILKRISTVLLRNSESRQAILSRCWFDVKSTGCDKVRVGDTFESRQHILVESLPTISRSWKFLRRVIHTGRVLFFRISRGRPEKVSGPPWKIVLRYW